MTPIAGSALAAHRIRAQGEGQRVPGSAPACHGKAFNCSSGGEASQHPYYGTRATHPSPPQRDLFPERKCNTPRWCKVLVYLITPSTLTTTTV